MKPTPTRPLVFLALLVVAAGSLAGDLNPEERAAKQAELDRQCEAAREQKLAPIRAEIYDECVNKLRKQPEYCRRYADGYNGERAGAAPRFYELPECVAAFEFRTNRRRP